MKKIVDIYYDTFKIGVGSKIKFFEEKQKYTVIASNVAFAVCTKPMNALKTTLYSVIDWNENVRGTENLIFGFGAENKEQCEEMLERLTQGESEVSHRHRIKLNIEKLEDIQFSGKKESKEINWFEKNKKVDEHNLAKLTIIEK